MTNVDETVVGGRPLRERLASKERNERLNGWAQIVIAACETQKWYHPPLSVRYTIAEVVDDAVQHKVSAENDRLAALNARLVAALERMTALALAHGENGTIGQWAGMFKRMSSAEVRLDPYDGHGPRSLFEEADLARAVLSEARTGKRES